MRLALCDKLAWTIAAEIEAVAVDHDRWFDTGHRRKCRCDVDHFGRVRAIVRLCLGPPEQDRHLSVMVPGRAMPGDIVAGLLRDAEARPLGEDRDDIG